MPATISPQNVLEVRRVSKRYCRRLKKSLWYGVKDLWREASGGSLDSIKKLRAGEFYAVRNVSFDVRRGECVAMLGPNGAGKSTMMKMLNGLIKPNGGQIAIRGRVGALIELGTGFNPVLSGRENLYINGAVLGLKRQEIDRRFEEIVEFAELEEFIHAPVKTYSSGMRMRLGFSIAAHLRPHLLLLDEVLAVGDVGFRMKCFAHLSKLRDSGTSIILVSHAMGAISRVADRAIVFGEGQLRFDGELEPAMAAYQELVGLEKGGDSGYQFESEGSVCRVSHVELQNSAGEVTREFMTGEKLRLCIQLEARARLDSARLVVQLESPVSGPLFAISSYAKSFTPAIEPPGATIVFELPELPLLIGGYHFNLSLYGTENTDIHDRQLTVGSFRIVGPKLGEPGFGERGLIQVPHGWSIEPAPETQSD